jgi:hypothetical protein
MYHKKHEIFQLCLVAATNLLAQQIRADGELCDIVVQWLCSG